MFDTICERKFPPTNDDDEDGLVRQLDKARRLVTKTERSKDEALNARLVAEEALKRATEGLVRKETEHTEAVAARDALDLKKAEAVKKRTGNPVGLGASEDRGQQAFGSARGADQPLHQGARGRGDQAQDDGLGAEHCRDRHKRTSRRASRRATTRMQLDPPPPREEVCWGGRCSAETNGGGYLPFYSICQ